MSATRQQVAVEARSWIGTPWRHQGFIKIGCDCIGLIRGVGTATEAFRCDPGSLEVMRYAGYSREPNPGVMRKALREFLVPILDLKAANTADILWFRYGSDPMHLGILTEPRVIVHSCLIAGKVIEHILDKSWQDRVVAAFRFPDLIVKDRANE